MKRSTRDERGSLVILVFALFLLLLTASLAVVDISDTFLAKRQLIEIGEAAITRAAHQISLSRYYSGNILMDNSGADGAQFRVPVDCNSARSAFQSEIASTMLRGRAISITTWSCIDDQVTGTIAAEIPILLKLPLGIGQNFTTISAAIGATSIIGGIRG
ncbi:MAG: hypothetical protein WCO95_02695 [Actinomycetes bacterium]